MSVPPFNSRLLLVLPVLLMALLMAFSGIRHVYLDLVFAAVDAELSFWGREDYKPTKATVSRTGQSLNLLLHSYPDHPDYQSRQAYFLSWQGFLSSDIQARLDFNARALATQQEAMQKRPAYRQGWVEVIEYASRATGGAQALSNAKARLKDLQATKN